MAIPCDKPCITCPDPNDPFLNLSSEAPDRGYFIGRAYAPWAPPSGEFFFAVGCVGVCLSDVSQEEADLCADRQAVLCTSGDFPSNPPPNPRPREVFGNVPQSCQYVCPDGTVNNYVLPANTIFALSPQAANTQAHILACQRAQPNSICMGDLSPSRTCLGEPGNFSVTASSGNLPIVFEVTSGTLPPGLFTSQNPTTIFFIGTTTVAGTYNFTLKATDSAGHSVSKNYSIDVFGITNPTVLTGGQEAVAYSETLTIDGTPVGVYDFAVVTGVLPNGLTLNATSGIISGVPTLAGTFALTIKVEDSELICQREFSIDIIPAGIACLGNPSTIPALTWVYTGDAAPCGSGTMAGGAGTCSNTNNFGVCLGGSDSSVFNTVMCNPGAPYLLTVNATYSLTGTVLIIPGEAITLWLIINGSVNTVDVVNPPVPSAGAFPPLAVLLPTGAANTVEIRVQIALFPNPSISNTSTITLT